MVDGAERWEGDVVLTDGGVVHLRPIRPEDAEAVVAFHQRQSPESLYYRYFSPKPTLTAEEVEHLTSVDHVRNMAFVAFDGDQLIGIGRYDHLRGGNEAEVAFQADEGHRGRGLATVFLEYLVAAARDAGLDGLVAQVLPDNRRMLKVFERAGFDAHRQFADGVIEVELGLAPTEQARMAIEDREQRAEARSVATLLAPSAVAVIAGVGEVGDPARAAFAQLVAHDFNGPVIRVGPAAAWDGPSRPGIEEVPEAVDLAVVAVAAEDLPATLAACGAKGVRGALLLTPATDAPADLVALARRSGMRLIGPGALGAVNTAADIRLHASPLAASVGPGPIGFLSQSGSLATALLQRAGLFGLGFSSIVVVGDKADLSANDLLQYWEHDEATRVIALYLQSFGNPRKFSRIARRVSRVKPIVAVKSGRAPVDVSGEEWPDDMLDALMRQTGVIRVDTTEELLDVSRVLASQPVPTGRRVAVVANAGGPAVVTADACAGGGLEVTETVVLDRRAEVATWACRRRAGPGRRCRCGRGRVGRRGGRHLGPGAEGGGDGGGGGGEVGRGHDRRPGTHRRDRARLRLPGAGRSQPGAGGRLRRVAGSSVGHHAGVRGRRRRCGPPGGGRCPGRRPVGASPRDRGAGPAAGGLRPPGPGRSGGR